VREQIKTALKATITSNISATVINLDADFGNYNDASEYPLAKVWMGKSTPIRTDINGAILVWDEVNIYIAPWCDESDWEEKTSNLMSAVYSVAKQEVIRPFMQVGDRPFLGAVSVMELEPIDTGLINPRGVLRALLRIEYRL
jgi:hypothetical protein